MPLQSSKQFSAPLASSLSLSFLGSRSTELDDESIREWFAYSYRIIYQIDKETLTIAAVIHGKRLLDKE